MRITQSEHLNNVRHQIYKEYEHKTIWTTSQTKGHLSLSQQQLAGSTFLNIQSYFRGEKRGFGYYR